MGGRQGSQHGPGDETVRLPVTPPEQTQTIRLPSFFPPPAALHKPQPAPPPRPPAQGPQPPQRKRGRGVAALIVVVLLLAGLVAGAAIVRPGPVEGWLGGAAGDPTPSQAAAETPEAPPSPVLVASADDAPAPTAPGVKAALDPVVAAAGLGRSLNISVVDVATGDQLYARGPDVPTTPASTTKLATAAAVLAARGPAYRIPTRVVAGAEPGEVVIIGGGDVTLAAGPTGTYPGAARLDQLATQVKAALGGTAPTRVIVDSTLFPGPKFEPSWDPDVPTGGFGAATTALMINGARVNPKITHGYAQRHAQPDIVAGQAFARALGLKSSAVTRGKAPTDAAAATGSDPTPSAEPTPAAAGTALAPGTELGKVESLPILRLVEFMLVDSDNVVAESLARQVALAKGQPASYSGGAAATEAVLADLGLPAEEIALSDGSGLSRKNRLSPTALTDVLRLAASGEHPELAGLMAGLPVAAWSGTLAERYRGPAADSRAGAGVVRAKTGTLTGVNAISGVVTTADGRLLAFAVLADKVTVGSDRAEAGLDKIVATLARCGCTG